MFKRSYFVSAAGLLLLTLFALGALPRGGSSASALTNCTTSEEGITAAEQQMLRLINDARTAAGVGALKFSPNLNRAAAWKSADSGSNGLGSGFSHTDSLGRDPVRNPARPNVATRPEDCGYGTGAAENIAYGSTSPDVIFGMWMGSSGHKANILMASYKVIGIGQHGSAWTTDFGYFDDSGSVSPPPATNTPINTPTTPAATAGSAATPTSTAIPAATSTPTQAPSSPATPSAAPTSVVRVLSGVSLRLSAGINLVTYAGESQPVSAGLQSLRGYVLAVYQWDASRNVWERYIPGGPGYVNSFSSLEAGQVYYIQVSADVTWAY